MKMFKVSINDAPTYLVEAKGPKAALAAVAEKCISIDQVTAGQAVALVKDGVEVLAAEDAE